VPPRPTLQSEIDKSGTGNIDRGNHLVIPQAARDLFGKLARFFLASCEHHRGVGRHIAMG